MKHEAWHGRRKGSLVTPGTGVWIETASVTSKGTLLAVTPGTGVWIETVLDNTASPWCNVTPGTGVWIETSHAAIH